MCGREFVTERIGEFVLQIILYPIRVVYFYGPRLVGLCGGEPVAVICYRITSVRSEFWTQSAENRGECVDLLETRFQEFVVGLILFASITVVVFVFTDKHFFRGDLGVKPALMAYGSCVDLYT